MVNREVFEGQGFLPLERQKPLKGSIVPQLYWEEFSNRDVRYAYGHNQGEPMSEILIAVNPHNPVPVGAIQMGASDEEKATQLPKPSGYRILCALPNVDSEYDSGIIKAAQTIQHENLLATVLFVVALGPDCYQDKERFPSGPWCKEGDFIVVRPNAGTRLKIHGTEMRMINDDSVEAVVLDPRGISRA